MPHFPVKGSSSLLLGRLVPGWGGWRGDRGHRLVAAAGTHGQCPSCQGAASPKQLLAAPAGPSWHPGLGVIYWEFLVLQDPFPNQRGRGRKKLCISWLSPAACGDGLSPSAHTTRALLSSLPLFLAKREKRVILLLCRLSCGSRNPMWGMFAVSRMEPGFDLEQPA